MNHEPMPFISPVAAQHLSPWQRYGGMALLGCIGLVSLYGIFFLERNPAAPPARLPSTPLSDTYSPPQLPLSKEDIQKLKTMVQDVSHPPKPQGPSEEAKRLFNMQMVAPTTVYSSNQNAIGYAKEEEVPNKGESLGSAGNQEPNRAFFKAISGSTLPHEEASVIQHASTTLFQGTKIEAVLEPAMNSQLPSLLTAVVDRDVYNEEGSLLLIPKGSKLFGQYNSSVQQGQNRIFVIWQRLDRPDHIDVVLNSPGTDEMGMGGMGADGIHHHFFEKFGTAALLSVIGAGVSNLGVNDTNPYNSKAAYRMAVANSFAQTAQSSLQSTLQIPPTLYVAQGKRIQVIVARDVDFYLAFRKRGLLV